MFREVPVGEIVRGEISVALMRKLGLPVTAQQVAGRGGVIGLLWIEAKAETGSRPVLRQAHHQGQH